MTRLGSWLSQNLLMINEFIFRQTIFNISTTVIMNYPLILRSIIILIIHSGNSGNAYPPISKNSWSTKYTCESKVYCFTAVYLYLDRDNDWSRHHTLYALSWQLCACGYNYWSIRTIDWLSFCHQQDAA
jgi:hypothetical protein